MPLDVPSSKESRAESLVDLRKSKGIPVAAELDPRGVNIEFVPHCCHLVSLEVDATIFFFSLSMVHAFFFFHAICAWILDMAVKQGTEKTRR